jgi:hypothetical protein
MRAVAATTGVWLALLGCGGQGAVGGTGGGAGTAAATGGSGGTAGSGGRGATGGNTGTLPACAIATQPSDPAGASVSSLSETCNTIVITTNGIVAEAVGSTDGGLVLDGGATLTPAGGTIQNGDYDLIVWQNIGGGGLTYRTLRVFGGGTYIEWAFHQMDTTYDGGFRNLKFNTTAAIAGDTMTYTYPCGGDVGIHDFDYTASGNDLLLFDTRGYNGSIDSADTYRRTCAR